MSKSQKYLICAVVVLFALVVLVFRKDLFLWEDSPGLTHIFQSIIIPVSFSVLVLLFGWFLAKALGWKGWSIIILFIIIEMIYAVGLHIGPRFYTEGTKTKSWFRHLLVVAIENRSTIQYQKKSAQYDKELFYILRPGNSKFSSFEFNTDYSVNSFGLRDTEEDTKFPTVAFLGDSFTMGWGINEEDGFPRVFEKLSGEKTLNMGVSSYGTARELKMLRRIKTDSLKLVVIQYCENDDEENKYFVENGKLGNRTEKEYNELVDYNSAFSRYYPFKYTKTGLETLLIIWKSKLAAPQPEAKQITPTSTRESDFFAIIKQIQQVTNVPIIVTNMDRYATDPKIIQSFETYANANDITNVFFVNLGDKLKGEDYLFFDDHINPGGHKKVGAELYKKYTEIQSKQ